MQHPAVQACRCFGASFYQAVQVALLVWLFVPPLPAQVLESASVADTGLQPSGLALSTDPRALIVANFGSDTIQIFPLQSNCGFGRPENSVTGKGPLSLEMDASRRLVYASYFTDDQLAVFSLAEGKLKETGRYRTGHGPAGRAIDQSGNLVFVSNVFEGTISVFERSGAAELKSRQTIRTVSKPRAMAVSEESRLLFVADEREPVIEVLRISDGNSVRAVSRFKTQAAAEGLLAHPSAPLLYVTEGRTNQVSALRIGPQGQLSAASHASLEQSPGALTFDQEAQKLFVSGRETNDVYVYDVRARDTLKPVGSFPTYEYPEDLVVASDSGCLYVLSSAYGKLHSLKIMR